MSRVVALIKEPDLQTDITGKEQHTEADDSKSSTSTELCDEPDRLSDFDSEEPTSISDTSSYVISAGEASVTKLPCPSPADKSGLPTPESLLENDFSKQKPLRNVIVRQKSGESFVSDTEPPVTSQSENMTDKSLELVDAKPLPIQEPLIFHGKFEMSSTKEKELLPFEEVLDITLSFPAVATDSIESSSVLKNFELASQREISSHTANVLESKFAPLKAISACETAPDICVSIGDNSVKLLIYEDNSKAVTSKGSTYIAEDSLSKQPLSDKLESPVNSNVSHTGISEQLSATEEIATVSSEPFSSFHTSELKMETSEGGIINEIILKEEKDCHYVLWTTKAVEVSEDYNMAESLTHFTEQPISHPYSTEVMQLEDKTVKETLNNICTDLRSVKITDSSMQKSTSMLEVTQNDYSDTVESLRSRVAGTLQGLHSMQGTLLESLHFFPTTHTGVFYDDISRNVDRDDTGYVESKEELKTEIKIGRICTEQSVPEIDRPCVTFSDVAKCDTTDIEQTKALQDLWSDNNRNVNVSDSENIAKLLELNQRLQGREQVIRDRDQVNEVHITAGSEISDTDCEEISDLLEINQTINLGRRNSERALKIIQENSEILQRILQCQTRRPNKLSEENSGGTTTIPSEANSNLPSIPTSLSAESVDTTSYQQVQPVTNVPKTDSDDSCVAANVTPEHDISVTLPSAVSLSSPVSSHSLLESDKDITVFSHHPRPRKEMSAELQGLQVKEKEDGRVTITEHSDNYCCSVLAEESLKMCDILKSRQDEKTVISPRSARSFTLSQETPYKVDPKSLGSRIAKPKAEAAYDIQVLFPSDKQFLTEPEDKTPELTGHSVHSSYTFDDGVHNLEKTILRSAEMKLDRDNFSTIQSGWKKFPTVHSNVSESVFSGLSKCCSPESTDHTPYCSYSSKNVKESLQFQSPPSMCWSLEKPKLKDDSSIINCTVDSHDLSPPGSSHSTYSSDHNTSKLYLSISRYDFSPTMTKSRSSEKESNTDYFQHDTCKYRQTLSLWNTKDSTSHPSDTCKSSSDKTEITPGDDYLQRSVSCKGRLTKDFQCSVRPEASSTFDSSSGTQAVVHRTTTRDHSRPHSTIISDVKSTEILNRSYSSGSIHGCLTRMRQNLSSPSASPDHEQSVSSFKPVDDESYSVAPRKTKSSVYNPVREVNSSIKVRETVQYTHSSTLPFESRSSKDLSPPICSSFHQSRWEEDDPSFLNSECRNESSDPQSFSTESSLISTLLSTTKVDKSYSSTVSPAKSKDIHVFLPPIKSTSIGSPTKSKTKFDPFPPRATLRQPKELGIKLGLYSTDCVYKNGKATSKKT
jgi:hypothetical protein